MKRIDMTGQKLGRLKVDEYIGDGKYRCTCDCGNEFVALGGNIRKGTTKSCGCLKREVATKNSTKHGGHGTRLYGIWKAMKKRCHNPNDIEYENYGGRGITVCEEWDSSFEAFRDWAMGNGYDDSLSIDRIRVNDPYEPGNCRWATAKQQGRNRRGTHYVTIDGQRKSIPEWCEIFGVNAATARHRLLKQKKTGMDIFCKEDFRYKTGGT